MIMTTIITIIMITIVTIIIAIKIMMVSNMSINNNRRVHPNHIYSMCG